MKVTYKQTNNYLNENDNEIWRGFTTMIPRQYTSLSDFTSNQKDACRTSAMTFYSKQRAV